MFTKKKQKKNKGTMAFPCGQKSPQQKEVTYLEK